MIALFMVALLYGSIYATNAHQVLRVVGPHTLGHRVVGARLDKQHDFCRRNLEQSLADLIDRLKTNSYVFVIEFKEMTRGMNDMMT